MSRLLLMPDTLQLVMNYAKVHSHAWILGSLKKEGEVHGS